MLERTQCVGIDVRMAQHTGIGRYIRGTVSALRNDSSRQRYLLIGNEFSRRYFPPQISFVTTDVPIYSLREQIALPYLARSVDCLHVPHYNAPLLWKKKLVVTIHDLIHLHFTNHLNSPTARLYARFMFSRVTQRADAIIAVSEYTKKDLIETLGIHPKKITVIHHGLDSDFLATSEKPSDVPQKRSTYFLYVGMLKAHKNVGTLIKAFQGLKKKLGSSSLKLFLIGTPDFKQKIVRKWLEIIAQEPDISLASKVSDSELKNFYRNAIALVFPSLCEGFGFPLLEAMASQTPIIASRVTSTPEVLGETAGLYFDPQSTFDLQNCMEQILENSDLRHHLVQEGLKRLMLFDWNSAAKKTEQIYESVLGSN